jgi:hypothetical protein
LKRSPSPTRIRLTDIIVNLSNQDYRVPYRPAVLQYSMVRGLSVGLLLQ